MNISVEEINIVNDGMYEIYTKFGSYRCFKEKI